VIFRRAIFSDDFSPAPSSPPARVMPTPPPASPAIPRPGTPIAPNQAPTRDYRVPTQATPPGAGSAPPAGPSPTGSS